jgi:predicted nucleic acid-binding protein
VILVPPTVFVDANILFSRTLRDWVCLLCLESSRSAYDLRWSEDVLAEWIYRMRRRKPDINDQALGGVRRRVEEAFPNAMVTGYDLTSTPSLPDPHDRHVLAAALHAHVDMLVTDDRTAFPEAALQDRLDVYTADEFLVWVADTHADLLRPVLDKQMAYFRKYEIITGGCHGEDRLIEALQKAGAGTFAERLVGMTGTDVADRAAAVAADET